MTTRDAIAGLVRALEAIALVRQFDGKSICARCNLTLPACDRSGCAGAPARAALANWNEREPLRDDVAPILVECASAWRCSTFGERIEALKKACADLDAALTPVPGTQETR